jgi:hypothetical protein
MAVQSQVADVSDVETKFFKMFSKYAYYLLALEESMDIISTAQMCIFARGVTYTIQCKDRQRLHFIQALHYSLQKYV